MVFNIIEVGQIGVIFFQFNFGLLLLLKAFDKKIILYSKDYLFASINFICGALIFIPSLINNSYLEIDFLLFTALALIGLLWTLSLFSSVLNPRIERISQFFFLAWFCSTVGLRLINIEQWFLLFIVGMYGIGILIVGIILYTFSQRHALSKEDFFNGILNTLRVFNNTGIGIVIYSLSLMIGVLLATIFGEEFSLIYLTGVLVGTFLIGYTLVVEVKETQLETQENNTEEIEKYKMLLEKVDEGILFENTEGVITFVNPRGLEVFGYTADEILGKHWSSFVFSEDVDRVSKESSKRTQGVSSSYEVMIKAKNGDLHPTLIKVTPIFAKNNEFTGVLVVYSDIKELKQIEEALNRTRRQLQDMFDNTPAAVFVKDMEGRYLLVNKQWRERTGYLNQLVIGKTNHELFPNLPSTWPSEEQVLKSGQTAQFEEVGQTTGFTYLATKSVLKDETGKKYALCNISIDITERKKIEEALREAKEKYQMLVEKMDEAVTLEDENGIMTFVNPALCRLLDREEDEIIGKHWREIVPPEEIERAEIETSKRAQGISSTYESGIIRRDGKIIPIFIRATPIFSKNDVYKGVLVVSTDISIQKQAEKMIKQVKLEEERYHAMLSHFLNNDLQIIVNNLDLITLEYKTNQQIDQKIMSDIIEIASRSSKTIDTVNSIFEVLQSPFNPRVSKSIVLLKIIDRLILDLRSDFPLSEDISINRETLNVSISGDKHLSKALREVLLFIISSNNKVKNHSPVIIKGSHIHPYFCIVIQDDHSKPIPKEISSRLSGKITDKWEYQGHYIGISLVSVIMQHYEGYLEIQSLSPRGNEFQLYLPSDMIQDK